MSLQDKTEEIFEICVCGCEGLTQVRRNTPIKERDHYVEGSGQLLPGCYARVYGFSEKWGKPVTNNLDEFGISL